MDPSSTALSFIEGRALLPFWISLPTGAFLVGVVFLSRPWPPRSARMAGLAGLAAVWLLALSYLLVARHLVIDPGSREVRVGHKILGLGPERRWTFDAVTAVVLSRTEDGQFQLALQVTEGEQLPIRGYSEVLQAEQAALALADFAGWKALRRGYRLEHDPVGKPQTFRTEQGKQGVVFDFNKLVRIVDSPGDEPILPLP